jgi:hypothetical protein
MNEDRLGLFFCFCLGGGHVVHERNIGNALGHCERNDGCGKESNQRPNFRSSSILSMLNMTSKINGCAAISQPAIVMFLLPRICHGSMPEKLLDCMVGSVRDQAVVCSTGLHAARIELASPVPSGVTGWSVRFDDE